jgi:ubiquinone/menaquinone biosynthesis C-methylase UbiE
MHAPTIASGREINLLDRLPQTKRDPKARAAAKTAEDRALAKKFGRDFFDGEHYQLNPDARILDVGAAKGFLLHDFLQVLPGATVRGLDVSTYAKENAHAQTGPLIDIGSADSLPYPDKSFDLVISINSIHNLPLGRCKQALREMERVSRAHKFVTIDAWRTEEEHERLLDWILTAETYMSVDDWVRLFAEVGYTGDYWWFIP